jgi:hypothetical protein
MTYYDYLMNIEVNVYEEPKKEPGLMDVMAVRLDAIRKLLAAFYYARGRFEAVEPELEEIIDNINIMHKMETLLDENSFSSANDAGGAQEIDNADLAQHNSASHVLQSMMPGGHGPPEN